MNHSRGFVDADTGVCTNKIEAKLAALKHRISLRARVGAMLDGHILAEVWRKKCESDLWGNLLGALKIGEYEK